MKAPPTRLLGICLATMVCAVACGGEEAVPASPPAFELCSMDQDVEEEVVSVHAGAGFTLAVLNTGRLLFWGYNEPPGLAAFTQFEYFAEPVYVPSHVDCVRDIRIAGSSICAIRDGGEVICWGSGVGHKPVALEEFHDVVSFANGVGRGVVQADGKALLVGLVMIRPAPLLLEAPAWPFPEAPTPVQFPSSGGPGCYIDASRHVYCFGENFEGTLGNGTTQHSATPTKALIVESVEDMAAGGDGVCARVVGGDVYCWGSGPVGDGSDGSEPTAVPTRVMTGAVQLSSKGVITAVDWDGRAWCWGTSYPGQCGGTSATKLLKPRLVEGLPPVAQVAAGFRHNCALTVDGDVYCSGEGEHGELGNGEWKSNTSPVKVRLPFD